MPRIFQFGEYHPDYPAPVLNERETRAGAGHRGDAAALLAGQGHARIG
jgi:hypothetical protein